MQREQTYAHLLNAVSENEKKYEQLKAENELKAERLHQLQIENDNKRKIDEKRGGSEADLMDTMHQDGDSVEMEYAKLSTEMEQLQCLLDSILERKKKMELIGDQVGGWTSKVC